MSTTYNAVVLMNNNGFRPYRDGDALAHDDRTILLLREKSVDAALDRAFCVGNRMDTDALGLSWSPDVRSVSVGDVVVVIESTDGRLTDEGCYACDPIGWRRLDARPKAALGADAMVRLGVAREATAA